MLRAEGRLLSRKSEVMVGVRTSATSGIARGVEVPAVSECLGSGKIALGSGFGESGQEGMHDDDGTRTKRQIPRLKVVSRRQTLYTD
jgi:hypothetical protein